MNPEVKSVLKWRMSKPIYRSIKIICYVNLSTLYTMGCMVNTLVRTGAGVESNFDLEIVNPKKKYSDSNDLPGSIN